MEEAKRWLKEDEKYLSFKDDLISIPNNKKKAYAVNPKINKQIEHSEAELISYSCGIPKIKEEIIMD